MSEQLLCQRNKQTSQSLAHFRQLPNEYKLFTSVDKTWKEIMRRTEDRPNALKSSTTAGVLEALQTANANLEKIQKCLEVCVTFACCRSAA